MCFRKKIIETVHYDAIFSETKFLIRVYFELTKFLLCKHSGKSLRVFDPRPDKTWLCCMRTTKVQPACADDSSPLLFTLWKE